VPNFLFLALWCVLANVSQNCNGTWQRHNWAVCFGKRQKITVSYSKFSLIFYSDKRDRAFDHLDVPFSWPKHCRDYGIVISPFNQRS
jgi:hypothetical protein